MTAALLASTERLRTSRARLAQAADEERRWIARDLHDGLRTRLAMLATKADGVCAKAGDGARGGRGRDIRRETRRGPVDGGFMFMPVGIGTCGDGASI